MFIMETLAALSLAIKAEDFATIARLVDSTPDDLTDLLEDQSDPAPSLSAFLRYSDRYDYHGIVLYDFCERPAKTISECLCRIAEVHEIDLSLSPFLGMSLTDLTYTDR